jgi:hypothetical protein
MTAHLCRHFFFPGLRLGWVRYSVGMGWRLTDLGRNAGCRRLGRILRREIGDKLRLA